MKPSSSYAELMVLTKNQCTGGEISSILDARTIHSAPNYCNHEARISSNSSLLLFSSAISILSNLDCISSAIPTLSNLDCISTTFASSCEDCSDARGRLLRTDGRCAVCTPAATCAQVRVRALDGGIRDDCPGGAVTSTTGWGSTTSSGSRGCFSSTRFCGSVRA